MGEKPEWFQITDEEQKPAAVKEIKAKRKFLKVAAIALPLVVVGAVAVGANGEEDDAPQISTSSSISSETTATTDKTVATTTTATTASKSAVGVSNPSTTTPAKPGAGIQEPSKIGGDDHEGFGDGDHEGRENHQERGDHDGRANAPKIPQSGTATTKN